ncbi:hypothetical protein [Corallococcus carmarthensis]|uniref:Uncharacterized protein n=1 Tax=Corallococcus carmarthensis TaxID=2316728 RepID=A0A3A8JXT6_9BACT|nr:hypothetical protein [Corallococcus carmarthensis]RKG95171.1 hypothetical protein D7X32_39850 [Corallococcus carmarthensis]
MVAELGAALKQTATREPVAGAPAPGLATTRAPAATAGETAPAREVVSRTERLFLLGVLLAVLVAIAGYIAAVSIHQFGRYEADGDAARVLLSKAENTQDRALLMRHIALMSGPQDVLTMRHITVFLGFVVVVIGAMFTLTGIEAAYQLRLKGVRTATTLKTSSPGLVLISLGAALVFGALYRSVTVDFGGMNSAMLRPEAAGAQEGAPFEEPYSGGPMH